MKKRLTVILSFILAVFMSFAFVACSDVEDKNVVIADKLNAALADLYNAEGYKAEASFSLSSDGTPSTTAQSVSLEKRGSKIKIGDYYFDISTGYMYMKLPSMFVPVEVLPYGTVEYLQYFFDSVKDEINLPDGGTGEKPTNEDLNYNSKSRTVTLETDISSRINGLLAPLYTAYEKDRTVEDLLNGYIPMLGLEGVETVDDVFAFVTTAVVGLKGSTVGELITQINAAYGIDIYEELENAGIVLDAETKAVLNARNVGTAITAGIDYVNTNLEAITEALSSGDSEALDRALAGLLQAVIAGEADPATLETKLAALTEQVKGILSSLKVKALVDQLGSSPDGAALVELIKSKVTLNKLGAKVTVGFDGKYRISMLKFEAMFAHSYTNDAAVVPSIPFLADNNYKMTAEIKFSEYTDSPSDFDMGYTMQSQTRTVLVYGTQPKDVEFYLECGGQDVELAFISKDDPDNPSYVLEKGTEYTVSDNLITVSSSVISEHRPEQIDFNFESTGYTSVKFVYLEDGTEGFVAFIQSLIGDLPIE